MSMTHEEAINRIKNHIEVHHIGEYPHIKLGEALDMALTALRPVSREQVEKVWRGEWITKHYIDGILAGTNFDECSKCNYQRVFENPQLKTKFMFCPACGAPMTDEAVQMVMERLEELHET